MLSRIKAVLQEWEERGAGARRADGVDQLHRAAAALMIEAGGMDGAVVPAERARIEALLRRRFDLSNEALSSLMASAISIVDDSVELHGFTRALVKQLGHEERVELVEMLWEVVYADGELHPFEANLLRRVAGLLYVTDQESGAARARALDRMNAGTENRTP